MCCQASSQISSWHLNTAKDDSQVLILFYSPLGFLVVGLVLHCEIASKGTKGHVHILGCKKDVCCLHEYHSLPAAASS